MGLSGTITQPRVRVSQSEKPHVFYADGFGRLAFVLDYGEGGSPRRFSIDGRRYLQSILRSTAKWRMVYGGRQVGKSVIIGVDQGSRAILKGPRRGLYVAPTFMQAREFSNIKFDTVYSRSPVLDVFFDAKNRSITEKTYHHGSRLTLRYAFRHADRIRGISADDIYVDELQDMDQDILPVIYECAFRTEKPRFLLSGTQKSIDGPLQDVISREGMHLEWVIPCDCSVPRKWNVVDEDTFDLKTASLVCKHCRRPLDMDDDEAQWVVTQRPPLGVDDPMHVYRICQPMEPTADLGNIVRKVTTGQYSVTKYKNEVWARPHQHSEQPLTRDMVRACCWDEKLGWSYTIDDAKKLAASMSRVFMGVDWGAGTEESHTLALVGGRLRGHFVVIYAERVSLVGAANLENDEVDRIMDIHDRFNVESMCCDYGLGYGRNMDLIRKYGLRDVKRVMLLSQSKAWTVDEEELYFKIDKTLFYDKGVDLIKKQRIIVPPWTFFAKPFADDMTNIRRVGGDGTRANYYRPKGKPDDTFSALIFFIFALALGYKLENILRMER